VFEHQIESGIVMSRNRYSVARSTDDSSILFLFGYRREHDLGENSLTQSIVKVAHKADCET